MHQFYKDLDQHGIFWNSAFLREEDHTYHFDDDGIEMNVRSVSALKKSICPPFTKTPEEVCRNAKPNSKYYNADPVEVALGWKNKSEDSLAFGKRLHSIIEYIFKGEHYERSAIETTIRSAFNPIRKRVMELGTVYCEVPFILPLYRSFCEENISTKTLKKDKQMTAEEFNQMRFKLFNEGMGGTVDHLVMDWENKCFYIYDTKTDIEIRDSNKDFPKAMLPPFNNLIDCELEVYSFQIWLYAIMVMTITGFEFKWDKSAILHYNKTTSKFKPYLIKNRKTEAVQLINHFFNIV
jgi:hypothetical protein